MDGTSSGYRCSAYADCGIDGQEIEGKKYRLDTATDDGTQQPGDVETRGAQHRMQRVTLTALQPAAVQAVISLGVSDRRLDGLAALEPAALLDR